MKLPLTFVILFCTLKSVACSCSIFGDFKTPDDLKSNNFIALVKIKKLPPLTDNKYMPLRANDSIAIDVIELFKGKTTDLIHDDSFNSDCAMNLNTGEEWLFFGYEANGRNYISRCSYSVRYRDVLGAREWKAFTGISQLSLLRDIYHHAKPVGSEVLKFNNSTTEVEQAFKNGKINGKRRIYYPSGKLQIAEEFKGGFRTGYRKVYDTAGHLVYLTKYKHGLKKESITYQDTAEHAWYLNFQIHNNKHPLFGEGHDSVYFVKLLDSLRKSKNWATQIQSKYTYSDDGLSYTSVFYGITGKVESEAYQDWGKKINVSRMYYKSGKLQSYRKLDQNGDAQIENDYTEDGKRRDFITKCTSCKFYFDKNNPPGAAEGVYTE
ncbi:hypothetical protein IDJ77_10820 [Mucilaginibacter sp. ZT4R22]|uniref:Antitoxin component YwqK of YwqJK toxin-antitoxin module n=1 Tax=Mucilaginibacter pankratovii TaxID=2772110 RepID=A0ABR7WPQ7_9SPHI|nr:hypothetical protein [Mucilaginibacter pankratovii]MBD1364301.1 hypothetical protein [Mucilaginibacter pankratovii]